MRETHVPILGIDMVHLLKNIALKVQHYEPVFFFFALPCFVGIGNGMINTSFVPEKPHSWNLKLTIFIYTRVVASFT